MLPLSLCNMQDNGHASNESVITCLRLGMTPALHSSATHIMAQVLGRATCLYEQLFRRYLWLGCGDKDIHALVDLAQRLQTGQVKKSHDD